MLSKLQMLQVLMGHWELVYVLGDAASAWIKPETDTLNERWEIIKAVGDAAAPALDDIMAKIKGFSSLQAQSIMMTEQEMEEEFLAGLQAAYVAANAAGKDVDSETGHLITAQGRLFDGERLGKALDLFQKLVPVLVQLAPLLIK